MNVTGEENYDFKGLEAKVEQDSNIKEKYIHTEALCENLILMNLCS